MHIPKSESQLVEIEEFFKSLEEAKIQSHIEYDVRDWLYVPNHYSEYRYILGQRQSPTTLIIRLNRLKELRSQTDTTAL